MAEWTPVTMLRIAVAVVGVMLLLLLWRVVTLEGRLGAAGQTLAQAQIQLTAAASAVRGTQLDLAACRAAQRRAAR
jgi:hypothetical protein